MYYDENFCDIYEALVENNHKNETYSISLKDVKKIKKMCETLENENILYEITDGKLICWLSPTSLKSARKTYTNEVRARLKEEEQESL